MNSFYKRLFKKYGENNCLIEYDKDKFKMKIILEEEEDDNIEIKVKLYEFNNGLILKFTQKKGFKDAFFDKFKDMYTLIKGIIERK